MNRSQPRASTLKNRIKNAMEEEAEENQNQVRSVLTAASALTSLGVRHDVSPAPDAETAGAQVKGPVRSGSVDVRNIQQQSDTGTDEERMSESVAKKEGDSALVSEKDEEDPSQVGSKGVEENVPMTFPQKLMEILSNDEISDIITWLPHGKGFIILQKKKFASEVMPQYFKQSKFTSFTRKLNRWGFTRITRGAETGAYFHPFFHRGNLRLCMQMCCQSNKLTSKSAGVIPNVVSNEPGHCVSTAMANLQLKDKHVGGPSHPAVYLPQNQQSLLSQVQPPGSSISSNHTSLLQLRQLQHQQEQILLQQQQQIAAEISRQQAAQARAAQAQAQAQAQAATQQIDHTAVPVTFPKNHNITTPSSTPAINSKVASASAYSSAVVNAAIKALEQSNSNAYLKMLLMKEKAAAGAPGSSPVSSLSVQQQIHAAMRAQHDQLERFNQQRLLAAGHAAYSSHALAQQAKAQQMPFSGAPQQQLPFIAGSKKQAGRRPQGPKRASAA